MDRKNALNHPLDAAKSEGFVEAERRIKSVMELGATGLDLQGLALSTLPESLNRLAHLEFLDLSSNQLVSLPESLCSLRLLQTIDISNNQLSSLPESLEKLTCLHTLEASGNQLTSIGESIGKLTQLKILDISENKLIELPESLSQMKSLRRIYLHGNSALGLPPEVLSSKTNEMLDYYFRARRGSRPLNEAKLILVGRGGVGKTCVIKRLINNTFDHQEKETPGIEIRQWPVVLRDGDKVRLHVWDFGGQEILHATHQFFLTERTLYLLVLSGREGNPTQDAEYWLQLIKSFGSNSPVLIVLNKCKQHPFDINRGLLLEKYSFIIDFVKTDCQLGIGRDELLGQILSQIEMLEYRKANFPMGWFSIKEQLASMKENYVTWDHYQKLCQRLGEGELEGQQRLANFMHILGIALNYRDDPRLRDKHVLNPRWVTDGIYSLLRAGQKAGRLGILTRPDLNTMLDEKQYPSSSHDFLLRLMEKFQLCFRLPTSQERYLVPELLGESQPNLKELLDVPGLSFRYQYEVLPEGLLPRFIVQTHAHSEINPAWRWRTGVVLARDACRAVVRADARERRVDIHISGRETQRRGLLAIIREKFDEQHRDMKGLSVEERVPVPGEQGVTISYRHLLELEAEGIPEYRPEGMRRNIRVADLLNGIETSEFRSMRRIGTMQTVRHADQSKNNQTNNTVIIYSHKDQKFLAELAVHLKPLERRGVVSKWSDKDISPGSNYIEEVKNAFTAAKIALMLVSPDFLDSDCINNNQLNPLLDSAQKGGMRILWIPVRACLYNQTPLRDYHPVIPPEKPIEQMKGERNAAWVKVCEALLNALND